MGFVGYLWEWRKRGSEGLEVGFGDDVVNVEVGFFLVERSAVGGVFFRGCWLWELFWVSSGCFGHTKRRGGIWGGMLDVVLAMGVGRRSGLLWCKNSPLLSFSLVCRWV